MIPAIKSEFRKLLTVRSTYFVTMIAFLLCGLFTYFGTSPVPVFEERQVVVTEQADDGSQAARPATENDSPETITTSVITEFSDDLPDNTYLTKFHDSITVIALFAAIVVILLMAHEYRYNTITYTLTASRSRSKVLLAKVLVSIAYITVVASLAILLTLLMIHITAGIKDLNVVPQQGEWVYALSRLLGYALGFCLLGLATITLVRSLTAGIAALFVLPTIDGIAGGIMMAYEIEPTKYLPFSALGRLANVMDMPGFNPALEPASVGRAITVIILYLGTLWIISWTLFLRRDAN